MARRPSKRPTRTRIVYRERPREQEEVTTATASVVTRSQQVQGFLSGFTFSDFRQIFLYFAPIIFAAWAFLGPYVDAKAEELLTEKLVQIGMDPANMQRLNQSFEQLGKSVQDINGKGEAERKAIADDVEELKRAADDSKNSIDKLATQNQLILDLLLGKAQQAPAAPAQ